ncbi:Hpt domain-containing protein [Maricurvus nonylphenolicus]|uniref:Hpt domain-containing protein n=1 Tax=Maricurvus nonylphenolicus TaxID=1008307 RepID=UPI0036F30EE6
MSNPHVDLETLETLKEVMEDDFQLLIETFVADASGRIAKMQQQFADLGPEDIRKEAHSLKGSSSNIGAPKLSELCFILEEKGRRGDVSDALADLEAIVAEFDSVKNILETL